MSKVLNCSSQTLPVKYLCLPLGGNARRRRFWEPVLDKVQKRKGIWKCKVLSKVRRCQLIKSVLNNLPTHFFSLFKTPINITKRIISLERRFFWGGGENNKTLMIMRWQNMEAPIHFGGLGFGNLKDKNLGLLLK